MVVAVVVIVVVMVVVLLKGIYSGLHGFSPDNTAQYFIHIKLRYCTLIKIVAKWLESLLGEPQSQY